jgi:hypothetical protein
VRVRHILEDVGIVYGGVAIGDLDMPPAFQRVTAQPTLSAQCIDIMELLGHGQKWRIRAIEIKCAATLNL